MIKIPGAAVFHGSNISELVTEGANFPVGSILANPPKISPLVLMLWHFSSPGERVKKKSGSQTL